MEADFDMMGTVIGECTPGWENWWLELEGYIQWPERMDVER